MTAAIALLIAAAPSPARADGGAGGNAFGTGGAGGADSATGTGGTGQTAVSSNDGEGGGGAGAVGGAGGTNGALNGGSGGAGGATPGAAGSAGTNGTANGAGGGGGGAHGSVVAASTTNGSAITGGAGGAGGAGLNGIDGGGGGGGGGYGVVVNGAGLIYTNNSTIGGGAGGAGGGADGGGSTGGNGGTGGTGVSFTSGGTLNNSGTISGGAGGAAGAGTGGSTNGTAGAGGAGVAGAGLTINNSGTISGGGSANAITFTGGSNTLNLSGAWSLTGGINVGAGGSVNFTQSNAVTLSNVISGAGSITQSGAGKLTLSGANTYTGGTTVSGAGTLSVSSDGALGDTSGTLNMAGGALQFGAGFTIARAITLASGSGGTFDTGANTDTLSGLVSGTGSFTKNGTGTLVLSHANSYTGATVINAGQLQMNIVGALPTGTALTVNSGGTLWMNGNSQTVGSFAGAGAIDLEGVTLTTGGDNTSTNFSGVISDTAAGGTLVKNGTGTLILDGANTFAGATTVNGGVLEIGDASHTGASLAGNVTVGGSGTLMGHGTIGGSVTNTAGGIVKPGGSIGTLSVASYTQGANSSLQIEVSPTAASKLAVTGTASLNGTLALTYDPGVYTGKIFPIVTAGSVTGTFSTVTSNAPNLTQSVTYSATEVDLGASGSFTIAPTNDSVFSSLGTSALLGGQQANDTLLGHLSDSHSGTGSDTIETALAGTAPTQLAFAGGARHLSDAVAQLPDAMAQLGGWFRATGTFASLSGTSSIPGLDTQGGGFMAGLDRPVAPNLRAGMAVGYSHTNISQHDSESGTLDTPRVAAYGSYLMGPWAFDATVGYAHDRIGEKRPLAGIGTASSSHDAHEATGAAQASYRVDYAGFAVMPNAGLAYVHLFEDGSVESGAAGFNLDASHRNADSLRPFIGISASKPMRTAGGLRLVPEADIRYSHELFATAPSQVFVGGGNFSVNGLTPSHDLLTLGGGLTAAVTDRLDLFADYHATVPTGNYWQQTITAGARYRF